MARAKKHGAPVEGPFVAVLKPTLKEPAWLDLNFGARCLYIALKSRFTGHNNGLFFLSVREAAKELRASRSSTERWFKELQDHGFIKMTTPPSLGVNGKGEATCWRLTEIGYMGQRPTREYKEWTPEKNKTLTR